MSRVCEVCGKGRMKGNTVSHSNRKAPRHYEANLQKIDGVKMCTKCQKTSKKEAKKESN